MDSNLADRLCLVLHPQASSNISDTEQEILAQLFSNPVVIKYLGSLILNNAVAYANLPLSALATPQGQLEHSLKAAYIKGNMGILQTLLSIPTFAKSQKKVKE